ncbi:MAG TPA: hypothetical protein VM219_06430 [Phycisphaerae bacterium]|nr:hypothetical protein [Phycisphaerae bacterium]
MRHRLRVALFLGLVLAFVLPAGCAAPRALEQSQRLQLAAVRQYRDEMAAYHEKVKVQLLSEKRARLDTALAQALAQAADDQGRVPLETAMAKVEKRAALEDEFRVNLGRLDAEFAERQAALDRAIELAEDTLDLVSAYSRLAALVQSLFVRENEAEQLLKTYSVERSPNHAGIGSESEPGGY